jgi:outer membrane lipoprotein-sorting protein
MNVFRRLPLPRLLALCAGVLVIGISVTAIALAAGSGPTPPAKPLAQAVHDAMTGPPVEGFSADVKLTNGLLEGANLASGGGQGGAGGASSELASSPLLAGASGRLWVSSDGRVRLELQAEKGDTQIIYDGKTAQLYDASTNTLYRYTPSSAGGWTGYAPLKGHSDANHPSGGSHQPPSVAEVEEAITKAKEHANLSEATPTNVGGKAAYTVRVSPRETGSLIAGAELSFDAGNGLPLRAAIYSTDSSSPVIELATSSVAYGPVSDSVFAFTPPPGAKIVEVKPPEGGSTSKHSPGGPKPTVTRHGKGLSSVWVLEEKSSGKGGTSKGLEGLPKVKINGVSASELKTALGTVLSFERSGVSYVLAGAVAPKDIEALARGL